MANVDVNINQFVAVTLTAAGAERYNAYYSQFPAKIRPESRKEGDELKTQLWHIMQVFGPIVSVGMKSPFKDCNITILTPKGI